jgi:predicted RNase H-like HicB family nuclease
MVYLALIHKEPDSDFGVSFRTFRAASPPAGH